MTYIPGTGPVNQKQGEEAKQAEVPISVININEIKTNKNREPIEIGASWKTDVKYWLIGGLLVSVVFVLITYNDWKSLLLIPLGPYIAYLAWYTRKWIRRNSQKIDALN